MKILFALSALLAAALAGFLFPAMKSTLLVIPFALVVLAFSGCTSRFAATLHKLPDGAFAKVSLQETCKFTSTTLIGEGVVKDNGKLTANKIAVDHTDPWFTKISFSVEGYTVQLSAAEKKKPLTPLFVPPQEIAPPAAPTVTATVTATPAAPAPVALPTFDAKLTPTVR